MPEVTMEQLLVTIGKQTVENDFLQRQVAQLQTEVAQLKAANGQKKPEALGELAEVAKSAKPK